MVMKTMKENGVKATQLLLAAVPLIAQEDWTNTTQELQVREGVVLIVQSKQQQQA